MFSLFKKKPSATSHLALPMITAKHLGIFPENIRTNVVGHDFCYDWNTVKSAAAKQKCNLDYYLCAPLVKRLLAKSLKSPITFWYAPTGDRFVVTVYSSSNVDFFDPLHGMPGYVEYGGNYLRPSARPFMHWNGKNVFRVHPISAQPRGSFLIADFGNALGLNVSESNETTYSDISRNPAKHFDYLAIPHGEQSNSSAGGAVQNVLCVSAWG